MHKINTEKLLDSLCQLDDRGYLLKKPVHFYLHELIVLTTLNEEPPKNILDVDFRSFSLMDLEEYFKITSEFYNTAYPEAAQLSNDFSKIKALRASAIDFF